jgi:hypothetical protein
MTSPPLDVLPAPDELPLLDEPGPLLLDELPPLEAPLLLEDELSAAASVRPPPESCEAAPHPTA